MQNPQKVVKRIATGMLVFQAITFTFWLTMIYPSLTSWRESIPWLVFMSVWANVAAHAGGLVAAIMNWISEKREDPNDDSV